MSLMHDIFASFNDSNTNEKEHHHNDKKLRKDLNEKQIDKMIEDSFPASDPSSTY